MRGIFRAVLAVLMICIVDAGTSCFDGSEQECDFQTSDQTDMLQKHGVAVTTPSDGAIKRDSIIGLGLGRYSHLSAEGAAMALHAERRRASIAEDDAALVINRDDVESYADKSCNYDTNAVVIWWFQGIFTNHEHRDITHDQCGVPCVEAATLEDCGKRANAIVYHLPSNYGGPDHKFGNNKINIGISMESTKNYPHQALPNLKRAGYNLTVTTNPDSDVPIMYYDMFSWYNHSTSQVPGFQERLPAAAFMARNCDSGRAELVSRLAQHGVPVHSLGSCAPSVTKPMHSEAIATGDKLSFINKYRVYLAFENSVEPGYVTEKVFDGYRAGCVNAYRGAHDVNHFVPPSSLIRVPDDNSDDAAVADAARKIKEVLENQTAWEQLSSWKHTPVSSWEGGNWQKRWGVPGRTPPDGFFADAECRICRAVYAQVYPNKVRFDKKSQNVQSVT